MGLTAKDELSALKDMLGTRDQNWIRVHDFLADRLEETKCRVAHLHESQTKTSAEKSTIDKIDELLDASMPLIEMAAIDRYWSECPRSIWPRALSELALIGTSESINTLAHSLRLIPSLGILYAVGVASCAGEKFQGLVSIFNAEIDSPEGRFKAAIALNPFDVIDHRLRDQLPGVGRIHPFFKRSYYIKTVISHVFTGKTLRIGIQTYDEAYREFELLLALTMADQALAQNLNCPAFGGEFNLDRDGRDFPTGFSDANRVRGYITAGLFGGDEERIQAAINAYWQRTGPFISKYLAELM
jgi:hypothetical protein